MRPADTPNTTNVPLRDGVPDPRSAAEALELIAEYRGGPLGGNTTAGYTAEIAKRGLDVLSMEQTHVIIEWKAFRALPPGMPLGEALALVDDARGAGSREPGGAA